MNKELVFLSEWGNCPEKAWSGIMCNLYNVLSDYYNVHDIDLTQKRSFFEKIHNRFEPDSGFYRKTIKTRRFLNGKLPEGDKLTVFQFAENVCDTDNIDTFIYQDVSVSFVQYLMEMEPRTYEFSNFRGARYDSIKKRANLQRKYYEGCKGVFTMGEWLSKFLIENKIVHPNKVFHVGGGINVDESVIDYSKKNGNRILFVGRDFVRKGGLLVIDAFKILRNRKKDVELFIAGPVTNPVSQPIDGYYFMGDCDYKKTAELFNLCDVFCMPSYFEAYGLVFIEALCFGLPVIGRDAYEMPYIIEENKSGFLLTDNNPESLACLMEKALDDRWMHSYVKNHQNEYLEKYSWKKVGERIHNIIG